MMMEGAVRTSALPTAFCSIPGGGQRDSAQWAKHGGQVDIGLKLNKIIII